MLNEGGQNNINTQPNVQIGSGQNIPIPIQQQVCPHCGYCPTCGRPRYQTAPYWPWYQPYQPWQPYIVWGGTTTGTWLNTSGAVSNV